MRHYSHFRVGSPALPTFYKVLWEFSNHMVLLVCIQIKQKEEEEKVQQEIMNTCFQG